MPAADRAVLVQQLALIGRTLREPALTQQYWRELASLQPENLEVRLGLIDPAIEAGDHDDTGKLILEVREIEGEKGTRWQFAQSTLIIGKALGQEGKSADPRAQNCGRPGRGPESPRQARGSVNPSSWHS